MTDHHPDALQPHEFSDRIEEQDISEGDTVRVEHVQIGGVGSIEVSKETVETVEWSGKRLRFESGATVRDSQVIVSYCSDEYRHREEVLDVWPADMREYPGETVQTVLSDFCDNSDSGGLASSPVAD